MIAAGWFAPAVVYGFFPCQGEGNDLIVYDPQGYERASCGQVAPRRTICARLCALRLPAAARRPAALHHGLFSAARLRTGRCRRNVGGHHRTTASVETQRLFERGEYTRYLYLHGLSVETAEALAEYTHKKIREELGIAGDDAERISDLFHQKYRGSRYSFGYPACPNLEDQTKLFALLKPEEAIGVRLTPTYLIEPEQSTSAIIVHHPGAKYFVV